jgi:hypothetical protein
MSQHLDYRHTRQRDNFSRYMNKIRMAGAGEKTLDPTKHPRRMRALKARRLTNLGETK